MANLESSTETHDELHAVHEMYLNQVADLEEQKASLLRFLGRLENAVRAEGNDLRALVRREDFDNTATGAMKTPFRTFGNTDMSDSEMVTLTQVLNRELDMSRDFRKLLGFIQTDDNMASIWGQLMTMMKLLEDINDR